MHLPLPPACPPGWAPVRLPHPPHSRPLQVALLGRLAGTAGLEGVEVLTVDKCQGRDKDCILLSLVRSNPEREAGEAG